MCCLAGSDTTALVQALSAYLTPNEINNYYTYPAFPLAAPAVHAAVETVPPATASAEVIAGAAIV